MIYEPAEDSFLLKKHVLRLSPKKHVLDMCTGSGIQAQSALDAGASSVLAVDISPESIRLLKKKKIVALQSDLFARVKGKYDLIVCNPPYLPKDAREDAQSALATTGGKQGDELILRFLRQAPKHLAPEGAILLLLSSLTPRPRILSLLKKKKLTKKVLDSEKLFMESLEVWLIRQGQ